MTSATTATLLAILDVNNDATLESHPETTEKRFARFDDRGRPEKRTKMVSCDAIQRYLPRFSPMTVSHIGGAWAKMKERALRALHSRGYVHRGEFDKHGNPVFVLARKMTAMHEEVVNGNGRINEQYIDEVLVGEASDGEVDYDLYDYADVGVISGRRNAFQSPYFNEAGWLMQNIAKKMTSIRSIYDVRILGFDGTPTPCSTARGLRRFLARHFGKVWASEFVDAYSIAWSILFHNDNVENNWHMFSGRINDVIEDNPPFFNADDLDAINIVASGLERIGSMLNPAVEANE